MWQPSFDPSNRRIRWLFCISSGIYLNIFIALFQPYQGEIFAYDKPFYYQFVFGLAVSVIFALTHIGVPYFFPRYFLQPYFTTARFLIWFFFTGFLCHIPAFFYDNCINNMPNTWDWFLQYEIQYAIPTLLFISVPFLIITAFLFYKGNPLESSVQQEESDHFIDRKTHESRDLLVNNDALTEEIPPQYKVEKTTDSIKLTDISGRNVFETNQNQLVYITSANNYIEVFYISDNDVLTRLLLRQTLKHIENQLVSKNSVFYRCHNEYIINKEKIIALRGNAKGYQLILRGGNKPIPVSRNKNEELIPPFIHLLDI